MALPRNFVIGMLVFAIIISGGAYMLVNMGINNPQVGNFSKTFNIANNITTDVNTIRSSIENTESDFGVFGVLNGLINSAWTSLKILFRTFDLSQAVFDDASNFLGIPTFLSLLIGAIILVIISFAIWSAIFQRDL